MIKDIELEAAVEKCLALLGSLAVESEKQALIREINLTTAVLPRTAQMLFDLIPTVGVAMGDPMQGAQLAIVLVLATLIQSNGPLTPEAEAAVKALEEAEATPVVEGSMPGVEASTNPCKVCPKKDTCTDPNKLTIN